MISMITGEKSKISREKGITLIALVVTIIVLLILAGVSIQMLTGQNGILKRAQEAKEKTKIAELKESLQLEIMDEVVENNTGSIDKSKLREILVKYFGEENVPAENDVKWDKFPEGFIFKTEEGYEIDIAEIYDENLGKMAAGTVTTVPEGKEWKDTVTPVTDGEGNVIPVPKGFKYLEGTKETGFVITDEEENEFVWVPCGEGEEIEYEKKNGVGVTWKEKEENGVKYSIKQECYTVYPDIEYYGQLRGKEITGWQDEGGDEPSVNTYGGFYIGRYEAGLPTELCDKTNYENIPTRLGTGRDVTEKNGNKLKPVSKKNNPSWNYITQANAKTVSGEMYRESESVTSQLIDSYAWDTVEEWIKVGAEKVEKITDSTLYGNYYNNTNLVIGSNGLQAMHAAGYKKSDGIGLGWTLAPKYTVGNWKRTEALKEITSKNVDTDYAKYDWIKNTFDFENNIYREEVEIGTGSAECTKTKNVYDLGGNVWEWTTEHGRRTVGDESIDVTLTTDYAVQRGGCFGDTGAGRPMCCRRSCDCSSTIYQIWCRFPCYTLCKIVFF